MMEECNEVYIQSNKSRPKVIVNAPALARNGLMYGGYSIRLNTDRPELDGIVLGSVTLEYNHIEGLEDCECIDEDFNLWLPSPERTLIDTIKYLDIHYIEGPLIESLQNYSRFVERDFSKLYAAGSKYGVSKEIIDYWINEADEETDMSG